MQNEQNSSKNAAAAACCINRSTLPLTRTFPASLPDIFRHLAGAHCHLEDFCLNRLYSGACTEFQRHLAGEIATLHKSLRELHLHGVSATSCRSFSSTLPHHSAALGYQSLYKVKANQLLSYSNPASSSASIITTRSP